MEMNGGRWVGEENVCDTRKSLATNEVDAGRRDARHLWTRYHRIRRVIETGHFKYTEKNHQEMKRNAEYNKVS